MDLTPILQEAPLKLNRPNQLENLSTPLNNLMGPPSPNKISTVNLMKIMQIISNLIKFFLQPLMDDCNKENTREIHILRDQLQQQSQQTKQALAQLILVREQLLTETNARIESQVSFIEIYCPFDDPRVTKFQIKVIKTAINQLIPLVKVINVLVSFCRLAHSSFCSKIESFWITLHRLVD